MEADFINLTPDNLEEEHLSCLIRVKKKNPGIEAKRRWLAERLGEGHVFRKLNSNAAVFIEYAPLETAWVPVVGDHYYYLYCLWSAEKGNGYGSALMEYCLEDARKSGRSGVCMLGASKQKGWLSDQSFAKKYGFQTVDTTENGYELLALSFDGTYPHFAQNAKSMRIPEKELTIYYDVQCPYTYSSINQVKKYCAQNEVPVHFVEVDSLRMAKELPCVFNNYAVFYKGKFKTVNLLDTASLKRILNKKPKWPYNLM